MPNPINIGGSFTDERVIIPRPLRERLLAMPNKSNVWVVWYMDHGGRSTGFEVMLPSIREYPCRSVAVKGDSFLFGALGTFTYDNDAMLATLGKHSTGDPQPTGVLNTGQRSEWVCAIDHPNRADGGVIISVPELGVTDSLGTCNIGRLLRNFSISGGTMTLGSQEWDFPALYANELAGQHLINSLHQQVSITGNTAYTATSDTFEIYYSGSFTVTERIWVQYKADTVLTPGYVAGGPALLAEQILTLIKIKNTNAWSIYYQPTVADDYLYGSGKCAIKCSVSLGTYIGGTAEAETLDCGFAWNNGPPGVISVDGKWLAVVGGQPIYNNAVWSLAQLGGLL
jgi:hypothetical protein